jgi:ABC-2 type transport system permease protein
MYPIFRKEIQSFLDSPIAYVAIGLFLTGLGLFTWVFPESSVLAYGFAQMDPTFNMAPFVYLILIPAITMRLFSEEKRAGTLELLFTKPVSVWQIVGGKYFASLVLVVLCLLPTLIYYLSIYALGSPVGNIDSAAVAGCYIGLLLLGAVFCSIGIFASAITDSQVTSFLIAVFLCFFLHSGFSSIAGINVWGPLSALVEKLGIAYHYQALSKGLIDSRNVFYLLSLSFGFLAGTRLVLQSRGW